MCFIGFLILLVISLLAAAIVYFGCSLNVRKGASSFISQWIVAFIGARFGHLVLGQWFEPVVYESNEVTLYIIPAFLGALALLVLVIDAVKSLKAASESSEI